MWLQKLVDPKCLPPLRRVAPGAQTLDAVAEVISIGTSGPDQISPGMEPGRSAGQLAGQPGVFFHTGAVQLEVFAGRL